MKYQTSISNEPVTWAITTYGYSKKDLNHFEKVGKELHVDVRTFEDKDKLITYMNTGKDGKRQDDKITLFANYSHGGNLEGNSGLWLAYREDKKTREKMDILIEDIQKFDPTAFDAPVSLFYACNTGTGGEKSFAQAWVNQVGGVAQAAVGKTTYEYMNKGQKLGDRVNRNIYPGYGFYTHGSYDNPKPSSDQGAYWGYYSSNKDAYSTSYSSEDYYYHRDGTE